MYKFQSGHRENVGLLSKDGQMFSGPHACKDYVHDAVCLHLYPEYGRLWAIHNPDTHSVDKKPNLDAPEFVLYCDKNKTERNGEKFRALMNQVESRMNLERLTEIIIPTCAQGAKSAPFIARADSFWLRSPIACSAYLTFLRLSIRMKMGESLDDFMSRMLDKAQSPYKDAGYIRVAAQSGNIAGLIEKRLPCLNREGWSDYLLSSHSRGLSWYHEASDSTLPMDEASLKMLRIEGRKFELERYKFDV